MNQVSRNLTLKSASRPPRSRAGKAMNRVFRNLMLVLLAGLLVGGGAWYYYNRYLPAKKPLAPTLQTAQVRTGDITIAASGSGNLVPTAELDLGFRTSGTLSQVAVQVGDVVKAGNVLARLDDTAAQLQVAQAQLNLETAQAKFDAVRSSTPGVADANRLTSANVSLSEAKTALADAQASYATAFDQARDWELNISKLADKLEAERDATAHALQKAQDALTVAKSQYSLSASALASDFHTAQLAVEQAQLSLESARWTLTNTVLTAPIAGTVTAIKADVGETVSTAPIMTLMNVSKSWMQIAIDETDLGKVALGYPVDVTFDALPDQTFQGTIVQVSSAVVMVNGISTLYAVAELKNPAPSLKVGMSGSAKITAALAKQVLTVPMEAVRETSAGQYAVFVVDEAQQLTLRPVEIGLKGASFVEIKSGLQLGETVSTGTVATQ